MPDLAPGIKLIHKATGTKSNKNASKLLWYQAFIMIITYVTYMAYHISRKPITIIRLAKTFLTCENAKLTTNNSWDFNNDTEKTYEETCISFINEMDHVSHADAHFYLSIIEDYAYLFSYAIFMFLSGFICERMDQRYFLAIGCLLSGGFTFMFGLAYSAGIRSIWYFIIIQIIIGAVQSTGWPGVVSVMANWFGKGKRGLIFCTWNTHTSLGNILGGIIAGAFLNKSWNNDWGLSFVIPGLIIGCVGFILFLFLIPSPAMVGLEPPQQHDPAKEDTENGITNETEINDPTKDKAIGLIGALKIPGVVEFSLCLFFAKLVSYTFLYWLPHYIQATSGMNTEQSAWLSTVFDVGGAIGGITAGIITDFSGMSGTTCSVMLVIAIPFLFLYETLVKTWCPITTIDLGVPVLNACYGWNIGLLMVVGILVNGPYALITTAVSAELGNHKSIKGSGKALATVTAIIDGTGSIGAALGPILANYLSPTNPSGNWDMVFYVMMGADLLALLMLTRIVKHEIQNLIKRRRKS